MSRTQDEFGRFFEETGEPLLRTVFLIVRDVAAAEDIVQETLLRVARRWPRVRRMEQRAAYARRIAVNLALDEYHARARESTALERHLAEGNRTGETEAVGVELHADLITALASLSPRARAVIVLRYYGDLSEVQVAETLGCSVGTVKATAWRALETLRKQGEDTYATR
jgi:RNA polymerase sigma-70 factor (sigma-E family)